MRRLRRALALLVVASTVLGGAATGLPDVPPPGIPGDDLPDAPAASNQSYAVEQGDTCVPVTPFEGEQNVAAFYDYRNPNTSRSSWLYSSFMPGRFTSDNGSSLFLYEGPDGVVSLVAVHDARRNREVRPLPHSAVTFRFGGLPESGEWVLVDDTYDGREDRFSRNRIDWRWGGSRTDGAVFRGLAGDFSIRIAPAFNERAALYRPDRTFEPVTSWSVLSSGASGPDRTELDTSEPVVVKYGGCGTPPDAALDAPGSALVGRQANLDANATTDPDGDVARYRWDFDGDGNVDRTTSAPTVRYAYDEPGTYAANVTVVDEGGNAATATANVTVSRPAADFAVADAALSSTAAAAGENVTVSATVENEGNASGTYTATLTVDGEVVAREEVRVPAGETKRVTFTYRAETAGRKRLAVGGVDAGTLAVTPPTTSETTRPTPGERGGGSPFDLLLDHPELAGVALLALLLVNFVASRR